MFNNLRDPCNKQTAEIHITLIPFSVCAMGFQGKKLVQPIIKLHYRQLITLSHELSIQSGYISADESIMGDVLLNLGQMNVLNIHKQTS